ncbi:LysM peptidoglycan-binding domain-containing protein [Lacinutrix sp. Hel_I_90]|uniref:LysM peptidoglycan-binding domain-containing protein n=1 Tax=Lacinutrix sp. Hel_I_90 TaxID=1249999 RepID=UPI0005C8F9D7|nr:LysM peptidoglycan-binding domain-containing protein [Lacinutrix sp. Hel_I_90]
MKKIIVILSLFICFSCSSAKAQNYKTHKVKAGETVESIAKQYNMSTSDIYNLNPDARKNLRPNAILIIPKERTTPKTVETETTTSGPATTGAATTTTPTTSTATDSTKQTVEKIFDRYINHRVHRKETLYGLSKEYNVTEEEIKKHNKFLYANNLKKGDKLQIPVFKKIIRLAPAEATTKTYEVKPKEGKWRIAYKYGISVSELEALNPEMDAILQPGQIINIPNLEAEKIKMVDEQYSYYTVLPKEGFYRLKIKTGMEQAELEQFNPGLAESGLKEGMILKVMYNEAIDAESTGAVIDDLAEIVDLSQKEFDRSVKTIAIMLPFNTNKVNSDSVLDIKKQIKTDRTLSIALDFYSGMLMALDELEQKGVNLNVKVYDTQSRESEVNAILRNNDFTTTDVVIGPLLPSIFNTAANSLAYKGIPVVSPVTKEVNVENNVFQSRPSDEMLKTKIIDYIKKDSTSQIIVISDLKRRPVSMMLKEKFINAKLVNSRLDKKTQKDQYNVLEQDLVSVLKPGNNIVFLETDHSGFVSNVASILNGLNNEERVITLVTTNQNKAFEDEEVSNYHLSNLHFTYPSISKIVSEDSNIDFIKNYKKEYHISPNTYAVRGYDLTMDVVLRLVTAESLFSSVIQTPMTSYIENKFGYKKKLFGGYYNNSVYIVRYNDLKIDEVKQ